MGRSDCEWMFGDAAPGAVLSELAHLNPWRWSGSVSVENAIQQIQDISNEQDRPIVIKQPSGIFSNKYCFQDCAAALDFLQKAEAAKVDDEEFQDADDGGEETHPSVQGTTTGSHEILPLWLENDVLMWKTPAQSGSLLLAMDLAFCIYFFLAPSPLALVSQLVMLGVAIGGILPHFVQRRKPVTAMIQDDSISVCADAVVTIANKIFRFSHYIFTWQSHSDTTTMLIMLYIFGAVAHLFDVVSLAALLVNFLFIVPVQLKARKQLKQLIETQIKQLVETKNKLATKIPKYVPEKED
jgi:hypothetical protein